MHTFPANSADPGGSRAALREDRRPLRLLQLTDLHLFGEPTGRLLGVGTRETFEAVLALALASAPADALALTGDLVHDETPAGYAYLRSVLEGTGLPYFCIPGNHDRPDLMEALLGCAALGPLTARQLGAWNLVFLDSRVAGSDGGHLDPAVLDRLETLLARESSPTLILLHQHPAPIGSAWMDTMGVDNGEALLALCDRYAQVQGVVFGHVHQEICFERGGYRVLGTPSTCVQFLPGSAGFAVDIRTPGYRELVLYPNGRLETRINRLDAYPEPPSLEVGGY